MIDKYTGKEIVSPLDTLLPQPTVSPLVNLPPYSADEGVLAVFRVLTAICEKTFGCGFVVELTTFDGRQRCFVDSRMGNANHVTFVDLVQPDRSDAHSERGPTHSSVSRDFASA